MSQLRKAGGALAAVLSSLTIAVAAPAQWTASGTLVSDHDSDARFGGAAPDGSGGTLVTWRGSSSGVIRAQRLDRFGAPLWGPTGAVVCSTNSIRYPESIASDGAGGAIISWRDYRSGHYDIYVQRLDGSGASLWTANGEPICLASGTQQRSRLITDASGDAIIAWEDSRSGTVDIFVQKIDLAGITQWTFDGRLVCNAADTQRDVRLVSDDAGGAILVWDDQRTDRDIYAQRVNSIGLAQWAANGIVLHTYTPEDQENPEIVPDGAGGAVVAWEDDRSPLGDAGGIYAQRIDGAGNRLWESEGVAVCSASGSQYNVRLAADGLGGYFMAWTDTRSGGAEVFAARLSPGGIPNWNENGIQVGGSNRSVLAVLGTGDGGGVVVTDWSLGEVEGYRLDAGGAEAWAPGGSTLSANARAFGNAAVVDHGSSATVVWDDERVDPTDFKQHIFAQRFDLAHGQWGHPEPALSSVGDVPNDQGGLVSATWSASRLDRAFPRIIDRYSVWRAADSLAAATAPPVELLRRVTNPEAPGPRSSYAWELVGTQTAHGYDAYSFAAPTLADSVEGNDGAAWFRVAAHSADDEFVTFVSDVMTGYSVDNLAPAAPLLLMANRVGADVELTWNRVPDTDLRDYSIYRATSAGVAPVPVNFLLARSDTMAVDLGAPSSDLFYIVTALDVHSNESDPSNEASVFGSTSVNGLPDITGLMLLPNRPNPFRNRTELAIGLPEASAVSVDVFDVGGRLVRSFRQPEQAAGWLRVPFDGRDSTGRPLANGLYFYRATAAGETATGKMVLTR